MMRRFRKILAVLLLAAPATLLAYPLDGYEDTGIRRVEGSRLATEGKALGGIQPPGGLLTTEQVDLRLLDHPNLEVPPPDSEFTEAVTALLGEHAGVYGIAVLDLTDPDQPRLAEHQRRQRRQDSGSSGPVSGVGGHVARRPGETDADSA